MAERVRYRVIGRCFVNGSMYDPATMEKPYVYAAPGLAGPALKEEAEAASSVSSAPAGAPQNEGLPPHVVPPPSQTAMIAALDDANSQIAQLTAALDAARSKSEGDLAALEQLQRDLQAQMQALEADRRQLAADRAALEVERRQTAEARDVVETDRLLLATEKAALQEQAKDAGKAKK